MQCNLDFQTLYLFSHQHKRQQNKVEPTLAALFAMMSEPGFDRLNHHTNYYYIINLFTTIHDGNFRRHSSMNVTIK